MGRRRRGLSKGATLALAAVLVLALVAADIAITTRPNPNAPTGVDIRIIEDDPINQIDHFYPDNVTVKLGQNISLAVQNGDDEQRVFTIEAFGVNKTISPGTTVRIDFQADQVGTFTFNSPQTPPSAVSQGRPGPPLFGNFTVVP